MTCYFRHLHDVFEKTGIKITKENKRVIDKAIHEIVGIEYKSCSDTWNVVKRQIAKDEAGFVVQLKKKVILKPIDWEQLDFTWLLNIFPHVLIKRYR